MKKLVKTVSMVTAVALIGANALTLASTSTLAQGASPPTPFCQTSRIQQPNGQWKMIVTCSQDGSGGY